MTVLVIAEHDNQSLKGATLNAVTAATKIGKPGGSNSTAGIGP